jgi:hypothetical protein
VILLKLNKLSLEEWVVEFSDGTFYTGNDIYKNVNIEHAYIFTDIQKAKVKMNEYDEQGIMAFVTLKKRFMK